MDDCGGCSSSGGCDSGFSGGGCDSGISGSGCDPGFSSLNCGTSPTAIDVDCGAKTSGGGGDSIFMFHEIPYESNSLTYTNNGFSDTNVYGNYGIRYTPGPYTGKPVYMGRPAVVFQRNRPQTTVNRNCGRCLVAGCIMFFVMFVLAAILVPTIYMST